jgi:Signal recognition particle 9 kDa protein (SRP9)
LKYKLPKPIEGANAANSAAILVAKAYDPVGGVCLKYETNRAVEVGRVILGFQELGLVMQNMPPTKRKESYGEDEREAMAIDEPVKKEAKVEASKSEGAVEIGKSSSPAKKKKKAKR